jgi:hypothetical protein
MAACRTRAATLDAPLRDAAIVRDAAARTAPLSTPTAPRPAWCWRALPRADLRAIDARGVPWSVAAGAITDESLHVTTTLPSEIPCALPGRWALEFLRDGAALLVADARFYVKASATAPFVVTPLCTDLEGAPWTRRSAGGWGLVTHRSRAFEPTLMLTHLASGATGWFAITGVDDSTTALVLDARESFVALSRGRRLGFVDRVNTVAGGVIAAQEERYDGLTRTSSGVVAWRDDGNLRTIVFAEETAGPYARSTGARPDRSSTHRVMRVDLARFVAVTDLGIELTDDRGASWSRVLTWSTPRDAGTLAPLERSTLGWLRGQTLAVATPDGIATERCQN